MSDHLSDEQWASLLLPINPARVSTFKKAGKEYSYVEAYELRAHLIRTFGYEWSEDVTAMELVFETSSMMRKRDKQGNEFGNPYEAWSVCYRAAVRLTVGQSTYTEWATGDAINQPTRSDAHDLAVKTAESQAFKRACMNLGDQFGLGLYNKGSKAPLVRRTLAWSPSEDAAPAEAVDSHITEPLAPESDEGQIPARETSSPAPPTDTDVGEPPAADSNGQDYVLDRIRAAVTFSATADAAMKMRGARAALDMANEFGLMNRPTKDGRTIGAWLTATLQQAHAEIAAAAVEQA